MPLACPNRARRDEFRAFGLAGKIGQEHFFPTPPTAVEAYRRWAEQHG